MSIAERWRRAAERAATEQVRVLYLDGEYRATSSSQLWGSYRLRHGSEGWSCDCPANGAFGQPCKHLWALAESLDLNLAVDIHLESPTLPESLRAQAG